MSDIAIKFENVSKLYRLGTVGTGWLSHDIKRWWITSIMRKEDPYLRIGETNDRSSKGNSDYVYALKDIDFEVKQGDVLGIIGKNGAGKSTLLKLLSRVTAPTTGKIYTKGRIASLLEVGTGFHPELTGRENIYMNGTIMGMKKWEIDKKLDEIVDFSGCERYLDTPVKRYSSGMMVRLGFAVAAHLEPEILVVDEVLAVGDAEFQKKAIGKMQDVSKGEGRTVLFVSHNMTSINRLCNKGLLLNNGRIQYKDGVGKVIDHYIGNQSQRSEKSLSDIMDRNGNGSLRFTNITISDVHNVERDTFEIGESLFIRVDFEQNEDFKCQKSSRIDIGINDIMDVRVTWLSSKIYIDKLPIDKNYIIFKVDCIMLTEGTYNFNLFCETNTGVADWVQNVFKLKVLFHDFFKTGRQIPEHQGALLTSFSIE